MEIKESETNNALYKEKLREKRNKIKNTEELFEFIKMTEKNLSSYIKEDGTIEDYGKSPIDICEAATAVIFYLAVKYKLSSVDFSFIKWIMLNNIAYQDNKLGLRIWDYDQLLFPQYEKKFEKSISADIMEKLQKLAKGMLDYQNKIKDQKDPKVPKVAEEYLKHWQSIVDGNPPFGFTVREEKKDEKENTEE